MTRSDRTPRYSPIAMILHWLTAAAFAIQIGLGWRMDAPSGPQTFAVFQLHKSIGITILLLTLLRIVWRLINPPPRFPATMQPIERLLAHIVHLGFYLLLLALPLSGWLIVSSSKVAIPTHLYGTIPWPYLPGVQSLAPGVKASLNDIAATSHGIMAWIALAAIALHVAGALKHQFVDRGGDLARMVPVSRRGLGVAALLIPLAIVGLMAFGRTVHLAPIALAQPARPDAPPAPVAAAAAPAVVVAAATTAPAVPADAPKTTDATDVTPAPAKPSIWSVRLAASSIRFHTAWSQGPVDGGFARWSAKILFDPAALDASSATIMIDMASVTAADGQQQTALPESDWFSVATHPTATWHATRFRHLGGDRYMADGTLSLRGVTRPLPLPFTLSIDGDAATMAATATIDRTLFGVGQGEWASTADLPATVSVTIAIKADRKASEDKAK